MQKWEIGRGGTERERKKAEERMIKINNAKHFLLLPQCSTIILWTIYIMSTSIMINYPTTFFVEKFYYRNNLVLHDKFSI